MSFAENKLTISRAFTRFKRRKEEICEKGMYELLSAAHDYLIEAHDTHNPPAPRHPSELNTLGWVLVKDGRIIEAVAHDGAPIELSGDFLLSHQRGDVLVKLQQIISSLPNGYCGVVMSDMANNWYRVDWEQDFLSYSADNIKEEFFDFFKPI